ncbi:MAG: tetratricopeptide repeat protein [Bacteroidetes bacterium SB0662_bin_6]|nr:tetratricopeptide repeat protein [Bacteroidetes bacterium SB0668_bin_1]MYE04404.1 tetratricopeptide repeat protein [Bacteroidetes bacterium SB0662_bin_6]
MTMSTFKSFAVLALLFCLTMGIQTSPVQAQAYKEAFNAAIEAARANDYPTARDEFARAAELASQENDTEIATKSASNAAIIDYNIGKGLVEQENFAGALERFNAGIAMYPSYVNNYEGKALALKKLERVEEAIQAYEALIAFGNEHSDSQALRKGETGIRDHFNFLASSALGRRAEPSASDAREAIASLEELQERVDPDADTYFYLAVAHNALGNYEQAVSLADQALSLHRGSRTDAAKIHFTRGEALMYAGNITAAKESFENARFGSYRSPAEHYLETL